jgi:hypothetical protein
MVFKNPYDYQPADRYLVIPVNSHRHYRKFTVSFPSAVDRDGPSPMGDVTGVFYQPKGKAKSPLVILVHGVGDTSTIPCHALGRSLVQVGIAAFVMYLPIHSRRLPADMKDRFFHLSVQEWLELYRVSVINIRQVLDWAQSRPEIDARYLGVVGISFGAYVSAIALGVDPRLKAGAILLTSGNQEKVGWTRTTHRIPRYDISEAAFREGQSRYLAYVNDVSTRGFENVDLPQSSYALDPYTFCSTIKTKQVFMTNALWDEYFPREAAKEFWQACGRPKQQWLPSGHATAWLFYPLIRQRVVKFFRRSFLIKPAM